MGCPMRRLLLALGLAVIPHVAALGQSLGEVTLRGPTLDLIWREQSERLHPPITGRRADWQSSLVVLGAVLLRNHEPALFGWRSVEGHRETLLIRPTRAELPPTRSLTPAGGLVLVQGSLLPRAPTRDPVPSAFAVRPDGRLLLGGVSNAGLTLWSVPLCDAYLETREADGALVSAQRYDMASCGGIHAIVPLPDGGALVSGWRREPSARGSFIATIGPTGRWTQEQALGREDALALVPMMSGGFLAVGVRQLGEDPSGRLDVVAWSLDEMGRTSPGAVIRAGLRVPGQRPGIFGRVAAAPVDADAFVLSYWRASDPSDERAPTRPELARVKQDGTVEWTATLSLAPLRGHTLRHVAFTALPDGDALAATSSFDGLELFRVSGRTGAVHRTTVPLPDCHGAALPHIQLLAAPNGNLFVTGSNAATEIVPGCAWLARLRGA